LAVVQLVGNLLQTGLGAFFDDIVQSCDMLRLQCWRPAAVVDRQLRIGWMLRCHGILLSDSGSMPQLRY
jgi:hypothetical protein